MRNRYRGGGWVAEKFVMMKLRRTLKLELFTLIWAGFVVLLQQYEKVKCSVLAYSSERADESFT